LSHSSRTRPPAVPLQTYGYQGNLVFVCAQTGSVLRGRRRIVGGCNKRDVNKWNRTCRCAFRRLMMTVVVDRAGSVSASRRRCCVRLCVHHRRLACRPHSGSTQYMHRTCLDQHPRWNYHAFYLLLCLRNLRKKAVVVRSL
jgi:hypothetical protein